MTYLTKVTSKGQITLPVQVRKSLKIVPGQRVRVSYSRNGKAVVEPLVDVEELRKKTQEHFKKMGFTPEKLRKMAEICQNGDGITLHVKEKYGRSR